MSKRNVAASVVCSKEAGGAQKFNGAYSSQESVRSVTRNGVRLILLHGMVLASVTDLFKLAEYTLSKRSGGISWGRVITLAYGRRGLDWRSEALQLPAARQYPKWFMSAASVERLCTILPAQRAASIKKWMDADGFNYASSLEEDDRKIAQHVSTVTVRKGVHEGAVVYRVEDVRKVLNFGHVWAGSNSSKMVTRLLRQYSGSDAASFVKLGRIGHDWALYATTDGLRSLLHIGEMPGTWRAALRLWMEREGISTDPQPEQSGEQAAPADVAPAPMLDEAANAVSAPVSDAAEANEGEARELIAQAKAAGKLPPQLEPVWMDIGRADPATLRRLVNSTPALTAPQPAAAPIAAAPANPGTAQPCARRAALAQERAHDLHALAAGTLGKTATHLLELRDLVQLLQHGAVEVERSAPGSIEWAGVLSMLGRLIPDGLAMDDQIDAVVSAARRGLAAVAEGSEGADAEDGGAPVQKAFASDRAAIAAAAGISRADAQGAEA